MDVDNSIFTTILDITGVTSSTADANQSTDTRGIRINIKESVLSPTTPPYQGRSGSVLANTPCQTNTGAGSELGSLYAKQEPRVAESARNASDIEESAMIYRAHKIESGLFDDNPEFNSNYFNLDTTRTESHSTLYNTNNWEEENKTQASRQKETADTFEFLVKSLTFANNYISMLSKEQLYVLRSIRPELMYNFLHEVARVRSDNRSRRAMLTECAFCKNNGESEECYTSHALKDWRGRVLCPVLRAFRCPRCGATGDRAHTIKYCPENDDVSERSSMSSRRARTFLPPSPPVSSPSVASSCQGSSQGSIWSSFNFN